MTLVLVGLLLRGGPALAQPVRYVDADATGADTGTSWADAFTDLQDALAAAEPGDEVWVAEGTYKPTDGIDRTATFTLASGVALYGGFDGTEETRDERDWTLHASVLSGELGDPGSFEDDSYHVVTAIDTDSTTVIDGLTIESGSANADDYPDDRGGAILAIDGSPTIRNCTFFDNGAYRAGGAVYIEEGSPLVEDTVFEENVANSGGGFYVTGGAPVLRRVTFTANEGFGAGVAFEGGSAGVVEDALIEGSVLSGAGILDSSPVFRRVTFRNNTGCEGCDGGAVLIDIDDSSPTDSSTTPLFVDCLFEGNSTRINGGAVYSDGGTSPVFIRSTFRDNRSTDGAGGAVYASGPFGSIVCLSCRFERNEAHAASAMYLKFVSATILNSTFVGNRSTGDELGGALLIFATPDAGPGVLVANTVFAGNTASRGGGLFLAGTGSASVQVVNTTFAGNQASTAGGAVYSRDYGGPRTTARIENAVLWGNAAPVGPELYYADFDSGPPFVTRSIVAGGCPQGVVCEGVIDQDPLFVRPPSPGPDGAWGTEDDDYGDLHVREGSPALDYGLEELLPADRWDLDGDGDTAEPLPVDLDGEPRVEGSSVDVGAYEGVVPVANEAGPEAEEAVRLEVHPNPTRGLAEVIVALARPAEVTVAIYDVLGRRVAVLHEGPLSAGAHALPLDVSRLPSGVYVVRAETGVGGAAVRLTHLRP